MNAVEVLIAVSIGYLLGSVSCANLLARHLSRREIEDLRRLGAGASTMYRKRGPWAAIFVYLGDCGKSAAAVWITMQVTSLDAAIVAGSAAVVGNNWPIFYHFKGGRGTAAAAGALLPLMPIALCVGLACAVVAIVGTRNTLMSSAALFGGAVAASWSMAYPPTIVVYALCLPAAVAAYTLVARRHVPLGERWRATFLRGGSPLSVPRP